LLRLHAAVLVQLSAPLDAEAFDARLDRHATGSPQQLDELRLPEIEPRLDPETDPSLLDQLQKLSIRQKDLIDEIYVFDALLDETVQLFGNHIERTATIAIAKIDLRAEGTVIGAAARGLHLRTRPARLAIEPVMVMPVPPNPRVRPMQCWKLAEIGGLDIALHGRITVGAIGDAGNGLPLRLGQSWHYLLALAHRHDV